MTIIQLPNGQQAEFPDSMSHEQIEAVLSKQFSAKQPEKMPSFTETLKETPGDISQFFKQQADIIPTAIGNLVSLVSPKAGQAIKSDVIQEAPTTPAEQRQQQFGGMGRDALQAALMAATPGIKGVGRWQFGPILRAAGRLGPQVGMAALTSKDPGEAAVGTGLVGGALEGIPLAGRFLRAADPKGLTTELATKIRNIYGPAKAQESALYQGLEKKLGNELITDLPDPSSLHGLTDAEKSLLSRDTLKKVDAFNENPTYSRARGLSKDMFQDAKRASGSGNADTAATIHQARQSFNDEIKKWMQEKHPDSLPDFEKAISLTRNVIKPAEATPTLEAIAKGNVSPRLARSSEVKSALTGFERSRKIKDPKIKQEHPFAELAEQLRKHEKRSGVMKGLEAALTGLSGGMGLSHYGHGPAFAAGLAGTGLAGSGIEKALPLQRALIDYLSQAAVPYGMATKGAEAMMPALTKKNRKD